MLSLNYENINYGMTQILKLSCASFSYVNISYVLAQFHYHCVKLIFLVIFFSQSIEYDLVDSGAYEREVHLAIHYISCLPQL